MYLANCIRKCAATKQSLAHPVCQLTWKSGYCLPEVCWPTWGYRSSSPTALQAWQPCPLWEPSMCIALYLYCIARGAPYKIWEGKMFNIYRDFRQLSWFWLRISPEWIDISKIGKVLEQLHFIAYWTKKFGELWSTNKKVIGAHVDPPNWTFLGDYFSP